MLQQIRLPRRNVLFAAIGLPLLLAGCGIVTRKTVNGVTTLTIDIAKLDAYAKAIQNGADALLANPLIATALTPAVTAAVAAALAGIGAAIAELDKQANGSATLTFDATNAPAALASLQRDAVKVFNAFKDAIAAAGKSLPSDVVQAYDALETIVALVLALMPSVAASKASTPPVQKMAPGAALRVLHAG